MMLGEMIGIETGTVVGLDELQALLVIIRERIAVAVEVIEHSELHFSPTLSAEPQPKLPVSQPMSKQDSIERVWDIIAKVGTCMLTTQFEGGLRARPLEARPDRAAGIIWFITDLRSGKEHEIEAKHDVGLVFIDHAEKAYLSLTARAEVRRDRAKAAEIWKSTDDVWWHGPDDPNVCVLR